MAGAALVNIAIVLLQYALIILIYYFLYKVIRMIYADLTPMRISRDSREQVKPAYGTGAVLKVIDAGETKMVNLVFELGENVSIGRSDYNDIVIEEAFVSHEHACITCHRQEYWLTDLDSTNGTFLNGQRITGDVALSDGSYIKIGSVTFKFER